jgi:hypothetical protein
MATCAELEQQASQKANELVRLTGQVNSAVSYNIVSADIAEQLGGEAATILIRINQALADLEKIQTEQVRQDCPRQGYIPEKRAARDAIPKLNAFIDKADAIIRKAREEQQASQKATEKENNAGTGDPGTAGQGPGADDLEEVSVTGKRTPETVTNDPGVAGGDGLEEVSVTGKRNPDALEEVQITGVRNPDELEEVSVTGKKATDPGATGNENTVPGIKKAQSQAALKDTTNFAAKKDWRVRLSLSPGATYLYKDPTNTLLAPLRNTDGIIFPYTPTINITYNASYDSASLQHSNYKFFMYQNSSVDNVNITCDFTAQDTYEANYLLAVIHFLRSVTKMFYGQDQNPKPGTPPPLCYLFGLGEFQFNAHPLAVTNFSYNLPSEVDYIRAGQIVAGPGVNRSSPGIQSPKKPSSTLFDAIAGSISNSRLGQGLSKLGSVIGVDLIPGGGLSGPSFQSNTGFNSIVPPGTNEPTYVPTKIQINITCIPIVSRYDISNEFSLKDYANGKLLQGVKRKGGGIW